MEFSTVVVEYFPSRLCINLSINKTTHHNNIWVAEVTAVEGLMHVLQECAILSSQWPLVTWKFGY